MFLPFVYIFKKQEKKPIISSHQDQLARAWSRCSHVLFTLLHALILAERIIEHVKIIRKFEKGDAVVCLLFLFKRYKVWI